MMCFEFEMEYWQRWQILSIRREWIPELWTNDWQELMEQTKKSELQDLVDPEFDRKEWLS